MAAFRNIIKRLTKPFLNKGAKLYYNKPRKFIYEGIEVLVHPDVFPPQLTLSTKILLDFITEIDLQNKSFLELGCGCGMISLFANKKGAIVTASDINEIALEYLEKASEKNNLKVTCVSSNLFKNLQNKTFDYIIINPPYYPKEPKNIKEKAWFCGENFEYFEALFSQLNSYLSAQNKTFMILSEDCNIDKIVAIASKNKIVLESTFSIKKVGETNTIYTIKQIDR